MATKINIKLYAVEVDIYKDKDNENRFYIYYKGEYMETIEGSLTKYYSGNKRPPGKIHYKEA